MTINWREYATYVGGKGRYWRIQFEDGTWQEVRLKADQMKAFILPLIQNNRLRKLIVEHKPIRHPEERSFHDANHSGIYI